LVRKISGVVNRGRAMKSLSENKRIARPGPSRPQRPLRCSAAACDIGSMGKRCSRDLGL
jgi:hypothetical protein